MRRRRDRTDRRADPSARHPQIDGYSDVVAIGHGGSAAVYRAQQDDFDRLVAIKVLHVDVANRRAQRNFSRERALGGRLSGHPNVVTVYDSGFLDGRYPYLAMEYFELGSLADRLAARGPLDVETVLHVGVRIAGALESAHLAGIVHRDVKPQNILMSRFGEPALADFGIASITEAGSSVTTAMTPVHAAPELLEGKQPTPAADVFALGSTLHTLLAGSPPFAGPPDEGVLAQLLRITNSDVPPIPRDDLPAALIDVLHRAMAKQPEQRFASAAELGRALQRVQGDLSLAITQLPIESVEPDVPVGAGPDGPVGAGPDAPVGAGPDGPPVASSAALAPLRHADHERDDPTVHPSVESTVAGRHALPPLITSEPTNDRRRQTMIAAVVAAFVIVTAGIVWLATRDDDGGAAADATTPDTATGAGTIIGGPFAPTDVTVTDNGEDVLVSWTDRTGGVGQHVVYVQKDDVARPPEVVEQDIAQAVIIVDPAARYCFQVAAIVKVRATDEVQIHGAEPECIRGATPITADPDPP